MRRWWWVWVLGAAVVVAAAAAAFPLTDRSGFCRTCHEMRPYHDAWAAGGHRNTPCVDCHVAPGVVPRVLHKFVALQEVRDHFFGSTTFPMRHVEEPPQSRCTRCHPAPGKTRSGFNHRTHPQEPCAVCHLATGHRVSYAALKAEGVLTPGFPTSGSPPVSPAPDRVARRGSHRAEQCARCHDLTVRCARCHTSKHPPRGACQRCHRDPRRFTFTHPASGNCTQCHKPPAGHPTRSCAQCHAPTQPFGVASRFSHPAAGEHSARSFPCTRCHPRGLGSVSCTCHGGRPPSGD